MGDGNLDLFGLPVRVGHGRKGRPPFEATDKDRNRIKLLLAFGWDNQRIANSLGVSVPTFRKHFVSELKLRDMARDAMEAERLEAIHAEAIKGKVPANKLLDKKLEKYDAKRAAASFDKTDAAAIKTPKPEKLGKKETRVLEAGEAVRNGPWGDDLLPGLKH